MLFNLLFRVLKLRQNLKPLVIFHLSSAWRTHRHFFFNFLLYFFLFVLSLKSLEVLWDLAVSFLEVFLCFWLQSTIYTVLSSDSQRSIWFGRSWMLTGLCGGVVLLGLSSVHRVVSGLSLLRTTSLHGYWRFGLIFNFRNYRLLLALLWISALSVPIQNGFQLLNTFVFVSLVIWRHQGLVSLAH